MFHFKALSLKVSIFLIFVASIAFASQIQTMGQTLDINDYSSQMKLYIQAKNGDDKSLGRLITESLTSASETIPEFVTKLFLDDHKRVLKFINEAYKREPNTKKLAFDVLRAGISDYTFYNEKKKLFDLYKISQRHKHSMPELKLLLNSNTIGEFSASSSIENQYDPVNVFDGDKSTAWAEGIKGAGIGQWIKLNPQKYWKDKNYFKGITVANGNAKNEQTFKENNRVKKALISLSDGQEKVVYLKDTIESQTVTFNQTIVNSIRLTILDVYKGTKYNKTCISEIDFI